MSLNDSDFSSFFQAIHGVSPFPWQERLVREVLGKGWPANLTLPTASGKTAILDVAVFALAVQARLPAAERKAPRRVALVIDRRIVVDDAFARARRIVQAISEARDGVLARVRDELLSLGGETPLDAAALRGGMYREDLWARTPLQPVLLCSTVDQVGSRLLHRGYGISPGMRPIHAGLLGHDTLVVLDEAHCSRPFLRTLSSVERLRAVAEHPLPGPFAVVAMTATPREGSSRSFRLEAEDDAAGAPSQALLRLRLRARKKARLVIGEKEKDAGLVDACIQAIRNLLDDDESVRCVLVVVNRVAAARALRDRLVTLTRARKENLDADVVLLTGRVRPLDRDDLLERWGDRIAAKRSRDLAPHRRPLLVVATQCVEVGADLDADALVTEACPLDSLRQRLGRLDRLGTRGESQVVLVLRKEQEPEDTDDPVYGTALRRTWAWLQERESAAGGPLDLGVEALASLLPEDLDPLLAPTTDAPLLFPAWCDLWVQTGPEPATSPDPAIFLHGPRREAADVRVVWRADLSPERPETWADTVAMAPPMTGECLPLPFWIAARWLAGQKLNDMAGDLMGVRAPAETLPEGEARALRWGGPDASDLIASSDLRPGDLVVVPSSRGGCDEEGWNPAASEVKDLAARAAVAARRRPVLRLHPSLFGDFGEAAALVEPLARLDGAELPDTIDEDVAELLGALEAREDLSEAMTVTVWALARDPRRRVEPHPSGTGLIVTGRKASTSSLGDAPVPLREHLRDVERWTRRIGTLAGLSEDLVSDLALAARLHDLGKADPRFQVWLAGGDPLRAARGGLLAKSERVPRSPKSRQLARIRSGYPKGGRHELLSLRLAESVPDVLATARNPVLVLHLVASHHGHCRPFAPVVEDPSPIPVSCELDGLALRASTDTGLERIDSGVPERFWTLVRRHGWWGLSFLETCLRLADHRASERPGGAA